MIRSVDITSQLFSDLKNQKTKIAAKVYKWLGYDFLREVILYGDTFWFVSIRHAKMPNYVYDYIVKWGRSKGYTHICDLGGKR